MLKQCIATVLCGLGVLVAATASAAQPVKVEIKTSLGAFVLELDPEKAPITVENFIGYVNDGFYEGTVFHRVMKGFMCQGGGFDQKAPFETGYEKKTRAPIKNEAVNGLKNEKYTVAMARQPAKDSATSQFFVNTANNTFLNLGDPQAVSPDGYAVFGKVVQGFEVIDAIEAAPSRPNGQTPVKPVVIEKATVLK